MRARFEMAGPTAEVSPLFTATAMKGSGEMAVSERAAGVQRCVRRRSVREGRRDFDRPAIPPTDQLQRPTGTPC
jgi:hypothetical protein